MNQDIIMNINRIDSELKNLFDTVSITEKSNNKGFYFEIIAESTINNKKFTLVTELNQTDLLGNVINWNYLSDPSISNSLTVERTSNLETIHSDMFEIVTKKRFDKDYLNKLTENLEVINESNNGLEDENIINKINNIFIYHDVAPFSDIKKEISYNENVNIFIKTPYKLKFTLNEQVKDSTKIAIEQQVMKIDYIDYISFKLDNSVEISVTE